MNLCSIGLNRRTKADIYAGFGHSPKLFKVGEANPILSAIRKSPPDFLGDFFIMVGILLYIKKSTVGNSALLTRMMVRI